MSKPTHLNSPSSPVKDDEKISPVSPNKKSKSRWEGKIIIGLVGKMASGKGTACQYFKEEYGANIFRFSTILRDILDRLYLPQSRPNMQSLSLILRQNFGDDLLAAVIAKDVSGDIGKIVGVDGVRRDPDIKYLKVLPGFSLINIDADQKVRWQRMVARGENSDDTSKTFEQFQSDEGQEAEKQINEVAKQAKFTINNNGGLEELHRQIDEIIKKLNDKS